MMDTMDRIKQMRKESGMTQKEFSAYFGIPKRTIEEWERGGRKPPEYLIRLLAYRLSAEGLIRKGDDPHDNESEATHP